MNRETSLVRTPTLHLRRHDHPAEVEHVDPVEEEGELWSVSFVEANGFGIRTGRDEWQMGEGSVFFSRPGLTYRCRHHQHEPLDICLCLAIDHSLISALDASGVPVERAPIALAATNRLRYLRHRVRRWQRSGADAMAGEALAGEIVGAIVGEDPRPAPPYRSAQLQRYAERVDQARHTLETRHTEQLSLADLSREAGLSLYHFARIFRDLAGVPPHRYLLKVRLTRAAELLRHGVPVTRTCYQVGFDSLSHFAEAFRREFGVVPSRYAGEGRMGE